MRLARTSKAILASATLLVPTAGWATCEARLTAGPETLGAGASASISDQAMRYVPMSGPISKRHAMDRMLLAQRSGENSAKAMPAGNPGSMMETPDSDEASLRDEFIVPGRLVWSADSKPVGRIVAIERDGQSVVILRNEGVIAFKPEHFAVVDDRLVARFSLGHIDKYTKPVPEVLRHMLAGMSAR